MAGLALALCHLVALTILTIAALAQVLRHAVSMEVSYEADLLGAGNRKVRRWGRQLKGFRWVRRKVC